MREKFLYDINGYKWKVFFEKREKTLNGNDGMCIPNNLQIVIDIDLSDQAQILTFSHEIVHAILDTQGRTYQKKFDLEEVCELIAWQNKLIYELIEQFKKDLHDAIYDDKGY